MSKTWHGYPIANDSHLGRPWWRELKGGAWLRTDGVLLKARKKLVGRKSWDFWYEVEGEDGIRQFDTSEAGMAAIDREHPLPAPPPRCGQVWVYLDSDKLHGGRHAMVCGASQYGDANIAYFSIMNHSCGLPEIDSQHWPPPGAVLVAGPFSPWMPT